MALPQQNFKLTALIIEPVLANKIRLKEALSSLPRFHGVLPLNSLREASDILKGGQQQYDIIFVSQNISKDDTAVFIKQAKELSVTQDAAFVVLFKSSQGADMAGAMVIGFDGMLAEPYSVDSLMAICDLSLKVKKERGIAREQVVLGIMMAEVSKQLDAVAVLKSCGYESARGMEKFKEACLNFKHLSPEAIQAYEGVAEKVFGSALPAKPPEKRYVGVSKRIKTKQVNKIIDGAVEG